MKPLPKLSTEFDSILFHIELERDPEYKEIHLYSKMDLEEDDDIESFETYNAIIKASFNDLELTYFLYGIYIEKESENIAEELGEILDEQNIIQQISKEIHDIIKKEDSEWVGPHWRIDQ